MQAFWRSVYIKRYQFETLFQTLKHSSGKTYLKPIAI